MEGIPLVYAMENLSKALIVKRHVVLLDMLGGLSMHKFLHFVINHPQNVKMFSSRIEFEFK